MRETTTEKQKNFTSADRLVRIYTTTRARRWPPHNYPVVLVELFPQKGSRVLVLPTGGVQWMPRFSELVALILQMGLRVTTAPADKPEDRRRRYEKINARRHRNRGA
jgi:hypothetical protein